MTPNLPKKPHLLFLFSDTGGGHRSGTNSLIEALNLEFPGQFTTEMVDIFREYAPPPFNYAPEMYPPLSRMRTVWTLSYRLSDNKTRVHAMNTMLWPYIRRNLRRLLQEHPCDMIVSMHPLVNVPVLRALKNRDIPFATVVLDLVSTHAAWFDPRADLVVVGTEAARQTGLRLGLQEDQIRVIGVPIAERFCAPVGEKAPLREKLGWPQEKTIVVLVGGGEGMGPLEETARAIDNANLPITLMVVCGRNRGLQKRMEEHPWQIDAKVYGFVTEMPDFMRAADILVTKAGPGTICEAFLANLPVILYDRMPGQEEGNVDYVVDEQAGVYAPDPLLVVDALRDWLAHPEKREQAVQHARRLARPTATREIARAIAEMVGIKKNEQ